MKASSSGQSWATGADLSVLSSHGWLVCSSITSWGLEFLLWNHFQRRPSRNLTQDSYRAFSSTGPAGVGQVLGPSLISSFPATGRWKLGSLVRIRGLSLPALLQLQHDVVFCVSSLLWSVPSVRAEVLGEPCSLSGPQVVPYIIKTLYLSWASTPSRGKPPHTLFIPQLYKLSFKFCLYF